MMKDTKGLNAHGPIFIVGYSRSGTKFICNLLERASSGDIEHLGELHFFGRISTGSDESIGHKEIGIILKKLADQYARRLNCPYDSSSSILKCFPDSLDGLKTLRTRLDVYRYFLSIIAIDRRVSFICDGTPRNSYYIDEILEEFPSARIIYMLRDPRDSILSQKRKWLQQKAKGNYREASRLALNYNPVLMARFWESSLRFYEKNSNESRVLQVGYEDMLDHPEIILGKISNFVGCPNLKDHASLVKSSNKGKYKDGLTKGEIAAIEFTVGRKLLKYRYTTGSGTIYGAFFSALWIIRLFVSLPVVYALNLGRFSKIAHELKKRVVG